eukprot:14757494-Alexandrium_andersonii.AAC.1
MFGPRLGVFVFLVALLLAATPALMLVPMPAAMLVAMRATVLVCKDVRSDAPPHGADRSSM